MPWSLSLTSYDLQFMQAQHGMKTDNATTQADNRALFQVTRHGCYHLPVGKEL